MIDDSDVMSLRIDTSQPSAFLPALVRAFIAAKMGACSGLSCRAFLLITQNASHSAGSGRRLYSLLREPQKGCGYRDSGENWARISPREWIINGVAFVLAAIPALPQNG